MGDSGTTDEPELINRAASGTAQRLRYELGLISQKTTFFIVTAIKTSNVT
jgi:hypothetical protein